MLGKEKAQQVVIIINFLGGLVLFLILRHNLLYLPCILIYPRRGSHVLWRGSCFLGGFVTCEPGGNPGPVFLPSHARTRVSLVSLTSSINEMLGGVGWGAAMPLPPRPVPLLVSLSFHTSFGPCYAVCLETVLAQSSL